MANLSSKINQTFKDPNIASSYGPYVSVNAAHAALLAKRLNIVGMTVGIKPDGSNTIEEYWYEGGTLEANLVKKLADATTVDSEFVENFTNPVQSKVIQAALEGLKFLTVNSSLVYRVNCFEISEAA